MRLTLLAACIVSPALAQYPTGDAGELTLGREFGIHAAEYGGTLVVTSCAALVSLAFGLSGTYPLAARLFHQTSSDTGNALTNAVYGLVGLPLLGAAATCYVGHSLEPGGRFWATAIGAGVGNIAGFMTWCVIFSQAEGRRASPNWTVVPTSLAGLAAGALAGYNLSLWNSPSRGLGGSRLLPPGIQVDCCRAADGGLSPSARVTLLRIGL
jgi:hypothetical protein